jgi:HK97 family phage prohead protease
MMEVRRTTISDAIRAKFLSTVGDREIRVVASDGTPDRMNDILDPPGVQLSEFRKNPVVLAQHDNTKPIAVVPDIAVRGDRVEALIRFPDEGVSDTADEYCRLVKSGVLNAVSVGFLPVEYEPRNNGGLFYTKWTLLELSIVSVGANPNALVIERGWRGSIAPVGPELRMPTTMDYGGTLAQRQGQLNYEHPWIEQAEAKRELILAVATAGTNTREGRKAVAAALQRYGKRMGWRR